MTNGKLLYVAGPYRSKKGMWGVHQNIHKAKEIAQELWSMGYAVICPHANTAFMDGTDIPDHHFLAGDLLMVRRCDGVVMAPNWELSEGATAEKKFAESLSIPTFKWNDQDDWVRIHRWSKEVA